MRPSRSRSCLTLMSASEKRFASACTAARAIRKLKGPPGMESSVCVRCRSAPPASAEGCSSAWKACQVLVKLQKYLVCRRSLTCRLFVRQTNEPMRFDGSQIENSVQNRSLQLGHYVWTTPPPPQLAIEGVFKHFLNPVRVRVFFISLHKRAFVSSALLSALQRMQQDIRFGSQIT